jgi:hypothetical protein
MMISNLLSASTARILHTPFIQGVLQAAGWSTLEVTQSEGTLGDEK